MVRDKNKPRGKMSSYAYFVQVRRENLKKKHPEQKVDFAEFSKECSEGWKGLSHDDKKTFEDMAKRDKDRYNMEMKDYVPPKGSKRKKKDPNAPKRPVSAFFVFIAEKRAKIKEDNPGISVGDTVKELGRLWNNQSAEDKAPYEKQAAENREKYNAEMVTYKEVKKTEMAERAAARAEKRNAPKQQRPVAAKKAAKVEEVEEDEEEEEGEEDAEDEEVEDEEMEEDEEEDDDEEDTD